MDDAAGAALLSVFEQFLVNKAGSHVATPAVAAVNVAKETVGQAPPPPPSKASVILKDEGQNLAQYANHEDPSVRQQAFTLLENRYKKGEIAKLERHLLARRLAGRLHHVRVGEERLHLLLTPHMQDALANGVP